jgi:CRP-like cAMP-binding protein
VMEQAWPAGAIIARAGEPANTAWWVGEGEIGIVDGDREIARRGPGSAIGVVEMLAASRHGATLQAATATHTLSTTAAGLIDVLEDHTDLGRDILAALAREVLDREAG